MIMSDMVLYEKKYKEAMDRMELCVRSGLKITPEYIFPELAESEDERMRKRLILNFSLLEEEEWGELKVKDICTWLEKQGQKSDKVEPKFHKGHKKVIIKNGEHHSADSFIEKARDAFCKVRCKGNPPRSNCTSFGTCREYDDFCKTIKDGKV